VIKKAWSFICEHGYSLMLAGMGIVVVAGIMLIRSRQAGDPLGAYVWPIAGAGLAVYILGRIGVVCKNKAPKKQDASDDLTTP